MITREVIEGRPATVAYINDEFEPVSADDATMIKIIFEDGEIRFGVKSAQDQRKAKFARAKARARELVEKYEGQPRDHGKFSFGKEGGDDDEGGGAVKDFKPGVKANGADAADQHRDQVWIKESPIKTEAQAVEAALIAQDNFVAVAKPAAEKAGVRFKNPGSKLHMVEKDANDKPVMDADGNPKYVLDANGKPKVKEEGVARFREKLEMRPGAPVARITDLARGGFVLNAAHDADRITAEIAKTHEVVDEGWRTLQESGYTDRAALFRDRATGLIGEIQYSHPDLLRAKEEGGGHAMYQKQRAAAVNAVRARNAGDAKAQARYEAESDRWNAKMRELYGAVLDKLPPEWKEIDGRKWG